VETTANVEVTAIVHNARLASVPMKAVNVARIALVKRHAHVKNLAVASRQEPTKEWSQLYNYVCLFSMIILYGWNRIKLNASIMLLI
jgi:hypothetical protein